MLPAVSLQLLDCPRLIETIVREFLPTQWDPKVAEPGFLLTSLHGVACASAMKFIRVLASGGRNATARLVSGSWQSFPDCKGLTMPYFLSKDGRPTGGDSELKLKKSV